MEGYVSTGFRNRIRGTVIVIKRHLIKIIRSPKNLEVDTTRLDKYVIIEGRLRKGYGRNSPKNRSFQLKVRVLESKVQLFFGGKNMFD